MGEDRGHGAVGLDAAIFEKDEPSTGERGQIEVVQGGDDRGAGGVAGGEQIVELHLAGYVQVGRGFVQDKHVGRLGQGPGDADPLEFTARKRSAGSVGQSGHAGFGHGLLIGRGEDVHRRAGFDLLQKPPGRGKIDIDLRPRVRGLEGLFDGGHGGDGQNIGHAASGLFQQLREKLDTALGIDDADHGGGGQGLDDLSGGIGYFPLHTGQGQCPVGRFGLGFFPGLLELGQTVIQGQSQSREYGHAAVLKILQDLKTTLHQIGLETAPIDAAIGAHTALFEKYLAALQSFDGGDETSGKKVDRLVVGIDREPTRAIDDIVASIAAFGQDVRRQAAQETQALSARVRLMATKDTATAAVRARRMAAR